MLDLLTDYGLTEIQGKVYYHLLRLGGTSSTKIAKEVGVHRSEVYRVLRELAEKGIVTEHKDRRPILFTPTPPKEALKILLQERAKKLERLENMMPKLIAWLNSQTKFKKIKPCVLLIDDDETIRKTISRMLEREGLDVDMARDGRQALEKSKLRRYNLALVDVRLPDLDGTKLLKMLREENPEIKEIVITGYPSVENAVQAIDARVDAYIKKPFDPSDLLAKIREKLEE
jgi:CheY-like chemotaxis protein/predicted transcriptional regulator